MSFKPLRLANVLQVDVHGGRKPSGCLDIRSQFEGDRPVHPQVDEDLQQKLRAALEEVFSSFQLRTVNVLCAECSLPSAAANRMREGTIVSQTGGPLARSREEAL